jgi:tRNA(Arg) A34 adenosine deaminase TadA
MKEAIRLARERARSGLGGPYGAVVVKDGRIVATGANEVTASNDPTAHAEIVAIRKACDSLGTFQLTGCELYTSCEPCPMCLGAIYWARPDAVYYATTRSDAAGAGFDDEFIYREFDSPPDERVIPTSYLPFEGALEPFRIWNENPDRIEY